MPTEDSAAKNPRRVAAGKLNRLKNKGITRQGRDRLRAAALRNKPWLHATGTRTAAQRAQSALNGKKQQRGVRSIRERRKEFAEVAALIHDLRTMRQARSKASS